MRAPVPLGPRRSRTSSVVSNCAFTPVFLLLIHFIDYLCAFYELLALLDDWLYVEMERQNSCVSCNRSVLRRRKHILTTLFLERYRDHAVLLLQQMIPHEVSNLHSYYTYLPAHQTSTMR